MKGENYYEYSVVLDLNTVYSVNQIVLGFNSFANDGGDRLLILPSVIVVQGGPTEHQLQNLGILGKGFNDVGYSFSAVQVYALNLVRKGNKTEENSLWNQIRYLKLQIRRSVPVCVEGDSAVSYKKHDDCYMSISFLSVRGYDLSRQSQILSEEMSQVRA